MKISRGVSFVPIVVTLEDLREARILLSTLLVSRNTMLRLDFDTFDMRIVDNLIKALQSEGITEL